MSSASAINPAIALPAVKRLSQRVVRLLGMNPGPFTLGGTNTYLVGTGSQRLLVDTGEGKLEHMANIRKALMEGGNSTIKSILLTHHHPDHVGGIPHLSTLFPNATFFKAPSETTDAELMQELREKGFTGDLVPIRPNDEFTVEGATIVAIPATGHTDDHVVFHLKEEDAVFTGDTILGFGSSVFANYGEYMDTLERLKTLNLKGSIYPGHAEVVVDAPARIDEYINHRRKRELQLVETLEKKLSGENGAKHMSILDVVKIVYHDTPEHLHGAAGGNMLQILRKLRAEGRVRYIPDPSITAASGGNGGNEEASLLAKIEEYLAENEYVTAGEGKSLDKEKLALLLNTHWELVPPIDSSAKL